MGNLLEIHPGQLVAVIAQHGAEAVVHLQQAAVRSDARHAHRRLVEHRAIARLGRLQPRAGLDSGGYELGVEHQPADLPVVVAPGLQRPADPVHPPVGPLEGIGLVAELQPLGQRASVDLAPPLGNVRKDLIVVSADQGQVAGQALFGQEAARRRQIAHLAVEDGDPQRRLAQRRQHAGMRRHLQRRSRLADHAWCLPSHSRQRRWPLPTTQRIQPIPMGQGTFGSRGGRDAERPRVVAFAPDYAPKPRLAVTSRMNAARASTEPLGTVVGWYPRSSSRRLIASCVARQSSKVCRRSASCV